MYKWTSICLFHLSTVCNTMLSIMLSTECTMCVCLSSINCTDISMYDIVRELPSKWQKPRWVYHNVVRLYVCESGKRSDQIINKYNCIHVHIYTGQEDRCYLVRGDVCIWWEGQHAHHLPNLIQLPTFCLAEVFPCMSDIHRDRQSQDQCVICYNLETDLMFYWLQ